MFQTLLNMFQQHITCVCRVAPRSYISGVTSVVAKQPTIRYGVNSISAQFHLVNSNSTSNLSIPILSIPIQFFYWPFFTYYILPWVGTYLEYLLWVVHIPSRIVKEEIFLN